MANSTETPNVPETTQAFDGIVVEAKPRGTITVKLVGVEYQMTPPKSALALKLATKAKSIGEDPEKMMDLLSDWMDQGFTKPVAKKIMARMDDPEDEFDFQHIMELMKAVIERASANPTS